MGVNVAIQTARESIIQFLKHAVLECTNNIYQHLTSLALLQQIEDFCEVNFLTIYYITWLNIYNFFSMVTQGTISTF